MKNFFLSFLLSITFLSVFSQESKFGLGLIIGEPTGISAKFWLKETTAIDAAAAWYLSGNYDAMLIHADFLKHKFDLINVEKGKLPVYLGIGGRFILANNPALGIRISAGISYIFDGLPLDTFFELAPIMNILPSTTFDMDGAVGIRYYF